MQPKIAREDRHGWPSQSRPDDSRCPSPPWSLELLVGVDRVRDHALSPDGRNVAFVWDRGGTSDLWLMPSSGGAWPRRLTFDRPAQAFWTDEPPRWSPDRSSLAYVVRDEVHLVSVEDGRVRKLTDHGHETASPIFSPDGSRIYHLSKRGGFANLCFTSPQADWPVALTRCETDVADPRPSPDGRRVACVLHPRQDLNRTEIALVSADGGEVRRLTGAPLVWDLTPRWSPDGRQLAFVSNRSGWRELFLVDPDSGKVTQLTADEKDVQYLAWSPDGRHIATVASHQGAADLHLLSLETGQARPLREVRGWHTLPEWSPDGTWILVGWGSPMAPPDLWRIDAATGEASQLTHSLPPALQAAHLVAPELVSYPTTGGATIPSVLFRPSGASAASRCPAIVYPHGGPTSDYPLRWDLVAQWLVAKGYAVLAPNYRGSTGYGLAHQHALHGQWGLVDTDDMLAAADYLAGLAWVDGERLGILGASYGSYLAVLALARDPHPVGRYKCGVALYGDSDILTSWAQADRIGREDCMRQMGHPSENLVAYRAGSPIHDVDRIRHPLLIMHGAEDDRVHPLQSEQLVEALRDAGKTFEYVLYAGEGHGLLRKETLLHKYATIERFLDWYLI
jgi:dipeptidyl aminopeptidase/acylaminoacyl peptidase